LDPETCTKLRIKRHNLQNLKTGPEMADKEQIPPRQNDELLKGVFEDNFADFLRFLYPEADGLFDFSRGIEFMNTELQAIVPNRERKGGRRTADLLAKVFMRDGKEKWIMVHTEIEGGRAGDFAFRMFQYYYRLLDEHKVPVEAIAFFTGGPGQPRPAEYRHRTIDTRIHFQYRAYHVLDHGEKELLAMRNPFALVVLACQKSLLEGRVPDAELGRDRLMIARALLRGGYDSGRVTRLMHFLKHFLYVRDPEINRTFDEKLIDLSGGTVNMGVMEVLQSQARRAGLQEGWQGGLQKGLEKGLEEGMEKGMEKGIEKGRKEERAKAEAERIASAMNLKKIGVSPKDIARSLGMAVEQVERL